MNNRTHDDWLEFLQKAANLPVGYSLDDLRWFEQIAVQHYPLLAPLVTACIGLTHVAGIGTQRNGKAVNDGGKPVVAKSYDDSFEVLRDVSILPKNADLIELTQRLLPDMPAARLDKMSRDEIIKRVTRHVNSLELKRKYQFASALRAFQSQPVSGGSQQPSFLSRWEAVIRDIRR